LFSLDEKLGQFLKSVYLFFSYCKFDCYFWQHKSSTFGYQNPKKKKKKKKKKPWKKLPLPYIKLSNPQNEKWKKI
jgi:hypothetical protein